MKLYYIPKAPAGVRWQGTQVDAKQTGKTFASEFIQREVPVDKAGLLAFLNAEEAVTTQQTPVERPPDELEQAELRAVAAAEAVTTVSPLIHYDYNSPFSARTALADIDASMCVRAVRQFDGPNLGKVVAAAIERISQLLGAIPGGSNG